MNLIFCLLVFEHLQRPWRVMDELFRVTAPGGQIVWAAPFAQPVHTEGRGATYDDFWRFTPGGAQLMAEDAGFQVKLLWKPGGVGLLTGALLGQNSMFWTRKEMLQDSSDWPLLIIML